MNFNKMTSFSSTLTFTTYWLIVCIFRVSDSDIRVTKPIRNMETIEVNSSPVFRVIVNGVNGDVIVGARNAIYRLSGTDLQKIDEFSTGAVNDSIKCLPPPLPCEDTSRTLVNNDNQVLLIKYDNKDFPLLLACGDAYQGMCFALKANNFSYNRLYGSPNETIQYVSSKSSSFAFFAPSFLSKDVLYVANAYDGRPPELSPPSISSRKLVGFKGFALTHESGSALTKVDFHDRYKTTYNVKYIYGFNYTHFSYFVAIQPITVNPNQREYETKLIRVCHNDNAFFSYMELPLICSEEYGNIGQSENDGKSKRSAYLIATTAYFGKLKFNKYMESGLTDNESDALYVSFGMPSSEIASSINKTVGSALCAFPIKHIQDSFTNATKECIQRGNEAQDAHILEIINGQQRKCDKLDIDVDNNFCGTGLNPYIGTARPLKALFLRSFQGHIITSLAVGIQNGHTVATVGTDDGKIIKTLIEDDSKPIFEMNLSGSSSDRSIRPYPAFDNSEKYLYLLSGNQLVKFPFGSCSLHTDCASCLDPSDPLNCHWCVSYCATKEECSEPLLISNNMCPPEIFDFTPKSGPLNGGTIVTISGDNLGQHHPSNNISITIADSVCHIIDWQPRRLQCRTDAVEKEVSGHVTIYVLDVNRVNDRKYDINGTVQSLHQFKYLQPNLLGVNPRYGPYDGGTNVTLFGHNLHIGSNRTIILGGVQCREIGNNSTFLNCISGRFNASLIKHNITDALNDDTSIKLMIDTSELIVNNNITIPHKRDPLSFGSYDFNEKYEIDYEWSEYFEYKPNPIITTIEPNSTIKSGNTNITVRGKHLNSVAYPKMIVSAISRITREEIRTLSSCFVDNSGHFMTCLAPPLRDPIPPPTIKVPIETQVKFIMDGVRDLGISLEMSRLIYFPDPIYLAFSESDNIRSVDIEDRILQINGKNLSPHYRVDIRINRKIHCNLTKKLSENFDTIYCKIENDENIVKIDGQKHFVDLKVGDIYFSPGSIRFERKPTGLGSIMIAILVPILFIILTVIGVMYYFKTLQIKKHAPFVSHQTNGDSVEIGRDNPPYTRESSRNTYVGRDPHSTRPLLPAEGANGGVIFQVDSEILESLREAHILIERVNLFLMDVIGEGHFGCVYKGTLHSVEKDLDREVAVKTLHSSAITREEMDIESFLQEGILMKDFKHHHVLTLIGVCFEEDGSPMVILPFMENGDLLSYIRDERNMPTVKDLLNFAIEIAKGMDYLSSQKFVHRDLAARNCMLDRDLCVKVADFGLSRDIYERDYYSSDNKKCKLPVKWMSPESLEKGTYNTKTDVWSYGVLVWELLTRGVTPYPDVDNWDILNYLKQGRRMPRPSFCPELLYIILLKCWSEEPKLRPTFTELVDEVQGVITKLEKGAKKQKVGLNVTYINYPLPNTYANDSQIELEEKKKQTSTEYETTC